MKSTGQILKNLGYAQVKLRDIFQQKNIPKYNLSLS